MKSALIYIVWFLTAAGLLIVSQGYHDSTTSILAQVEPQKYAISYQKPVRIKELYVIPGQQVKKGDPLLKVERPDLLLDHERKMKQLENLKSKLQILHLEKSNKSNLLRLDYQRKNDEVNVDLKRIELLVANQSAVSNNLRELNIWNDSLPSQDNQYLKLRLGLLKEQLANESKQYHLRLKSIDQVLALEESNIKLDIDHLQQEIDLYNQEEAALTQYANLDGTIGNVYVQDEELVSPYVTLLSVYDDNPRIIKALMNEQQRADIKTGDKVLVESTNRKHSVSGEVIEIGSRIVEYPDRLRTFKEVPVYGRELFVKIAEGSSFLNGEKVYVRVK